MSLSADQLADLRGDVGDDGTVFTDAELNRLYTRASSNYTLTVIMTLRQILADGAKLHNYQIAQSRHDLGQVFDHIRYLLDYWETVNNKGSAQVKFVALRGVPPHDKDEP